jgi:predicted exporter
VICAFATLFIGLITYFYFKDLKLLLPIVLSISIGFFTGYVATITIFKTFHVLTLVFATTLIGIGVDYSYHYIFSEKINAEFVKNLTLSLISTVTAFILLYLTNIELLKEISIFVSTGLIAIYLTVLLIYPNFKFKKAIRTIKISDFVKKYKMIFSSIIAVIVLIGLFNINFNDSLNAFYEPTKNLKKAEILFSKVSQQNFAQSKIIAIKGNSYEDLLQKEEIITDKLNANNISFFSLSKIFPSIKRQNENIKLVKDLYKNDLKNFEDYLSTKQINDLKNTKTSPSLPNFNKYNSLKNFMLQENTSIIFINSKELPTINEDFTEIIDINENCTKYLKEYRDTLLKLFPIVLSIVFAILCFIYGLKKSIRILLPPTIGCFFAITLLSIFNVSINMFTIIALFLILGFTIDYSIFRAGNDKNSEDAISISCMTTLFSFCALSFVSFKFISSLSLVLFLGILTSYITGILLIQNKNKEM